MFIRFPDEPLAWLSQIGRDQSLGHLAVRVGVVLCDFQNRVQGTKYCTQEVIGQTIGVSDRSVRTAIGQLLQLRHLAVEQRGGRVANHYRALIHFRPINSTEAADSRGSYQGDDPDADLRAMLDKALEG